MKKKLTYILAALAVIAVAAVLIAQGPVQGPQVPDEPRLVIPPEERAKMSPERAARIQRLIDYGEAFRQGKIQPPPPVDSVRARVQLLDMIANADDDQIVSYYMAVRDTKATLDRFDTALGRIEGRLHEMSDGRRLEY